MFYDNIAIKGSTIHVHKSIKSLTIGLVFLDMLCLWVIVGTIWDATHYEGYRVSLLVVICFIYVAFFVVLLFLTAFVITFKSGIDVVFSGSRILLKKGKAKIISIPLSACKKIIVSTAISTHQRRSTVVSVHVETSEYGIKNNSSGDLGNTSRENDCIISLFTFSCPCNFSEFHVICMDDIESLKNALCVFSGDIPVIVKAGDAKLLGKGGAKILGGAELPPEAGVFENRTDQSDVADGGDAGIVGGRTE